MGTNRWNIKKYGRGIYNNMSALIYIELKLTTNYISTSS